MIEQVRYTIKLRTGPDKGKKIYRKAPIDRIEYLLSGDKFNNQECGNFYGMSFIAGNKPRGVEPEDIVWFTPGDIRSVVLFANTKRTANK